MSRDESRGVTVRNSISPSGTEHVILLNGPCADLRYKTRRGDGQFARKTPQTPDQRKTCPPPNNNMQNTTTAAEKKKALIAARDARIEAERKRAEEEKVRAEAEAAELAGLEKMEEEEKAKAEAERKAREEEAKKKAEEAKKKKAEEEKKKKAEEEKKRKAEEEKKKAELQAMRLVTPADEEALLEVLRMQGVESPVLRAGPSTEGAEPCWACRSQDKECEWREHKRQVQPT